MGTNSSRPVAEVAGSQATQARSSSASRLALQRLKKGQSCVTEIAIHHE
jgi:hypothetical protein